MDSSAGGRNVDVTIGGDVSGQFSIGDDVRQTQITGAAAGLTDADRAEFRNALAAFRDQVACDAPPDQRDAALARVDELEDAASDAEPDPTTFQLVGRWFVKHIPALAGGAAALINPILGKLVEAGADVAADLIKKRFDPEPPKKP
jgi:hypothetical protein